MFDIFKARKTEEPNVPAVGVEAEKSQQWQKAKQQAEEGERAVLDASIPSSAIPNQALFGDDPYDQKRHLELERLQLGLPVDDTYIEPEPAKSVAAVFNPNSMGNARIRGNSPEEASNASEVSGVLDPEMDAYLQTQMAEEAAAELAKDQDRKPIVEN